MIIKGQKINDRYQILRTIGEGGMANVYLAYDTILDRNVAVKILRGDLADDEKFVRRFQREAISASSLNHPNIVEMYDVGEDDGKYYIVMEYVDGKTLKNLVKKRGVLTIPEVIDIMLQLTSGIACAHDSYIIHRDLKPQNVLMMEDGRVKITDFGIAMALNSNELTQTNSVMGSVHYLPPEQANGSGSTIKSDIYSLGIMMYELLSGKVPFKGDNAVEIAIKQMKEPIPSLCKENPDIPQSIENIILKACAKNPKNRYDNVREMYDDLKDALLDENRNSLKVTYQFPEQELEETKVMPNLSRMVKEEPKAVVKKKNRLDKTLLITGGICVFLFMLVCIVIILYPKLTEVPEVKIPDVANLEVTEAINILKNAGLDVSETTVEKQSDTIPKGKVISTNPLAGLFTKKQKPITLIISSGSDLVTLENYVGQNYKTVEANLKNVGINVILEKQSIKKEDRDKYKENTVTEQSSAAGTKLGPNDTIVIYYAVYVDDYPDFVKDKWVVTDIEDFCKKNNISLKIEYVEREDLAAGTVIYQSRTGEVISGSQLLIRVAKAPESSTDFVE